MTVDAILNEIRRQAETRSEDELGDPQVTERKYIATIVTDAEHYEGEIIAAKHGYVQIRCFRHHLSGQDVFVLTQHIRAVHVRWAF